MSEATRLMILTKALQPGLVKRLVIVNWRQLALAGALTGAILGGLTVWACVSYGSVGRCLLAWNGIRLYVPSPVVRLGTLQEGRTYEAKFAIENLGATPVQLIGFNSSCDCVAPGHFPVTLAGWSRTDLAVSYKPGSDQPAAKLVRIFTSDPATPELRLEVSAEAITPDPARIDKLNQPDSESILEPINPASSSGR